SDAEGRSVWTGTPPSGVTFRAAVKDRAGTVWIATDHGLYRIVKAGLETVPGRSPWGRLLSDNIQCLGRDTTGCLWLGTDRGVNLYSAGKWQEVTGEDGLPVLDVRSITFGADGAAWFGTARGAARWLNGKWRCYAAPRWLPGERVNGIALDKSGDAWIATDGGVARIEFRPMTCPEKAVHYEEVTAARHNRRGYVTVSQLKRAGDLTDSAHEASDNDGLWTSLYLSAQCFRWAVTHDPQARANAKKSMEAML